MLPNRSALVAIVGMAGSGKSKSADYFKSQGYPVLRFGDITDQGLKKLALPLTAENERSFREDLRKKLGMAAYAVSLEPFIEKATKQAKIIILDGLYSWEEYVYLKEKFPQLLLLSIYAQPSTRYQRLRMRPIRPLTPGQARQRDIAELTALNKGGPIALADFLIVNNHDQEKLYKKLDRFIQDVLKI
jgi:dephospho-CoA kinase